ncbi:hypothetical protein MAR_006974 [Mya arenaria]|uniref:Uncharacterized protein n=1 Tax=Mya arenaria TaxID=6604 RepID=A0ABY7DB44_MYAAR|nr:hypothetical protein MAR_006974 [Mya arenaria]
MKELFKKFPYSAVLPKLKVIECKSDDHYHAIEDHKDLYQKFEEGNHMVRKSDRLWAGLSVNLTIEQVLVRSMKPSGDLTRGRGAAYHMTPCKSTTTLAVSLTVTGARQTRDMKDTPEFRTISLKETPSVQIQACEYELCSHPPALFDTSLLFRQPQQLVLADATLALLSPDFSGITGQDQNALDGGALVQCIPCTRGIPHTIKYAGCALSTSQGSMERQLLCLMVIRAHP